MERETSSSSSEWEEDLENAAVLAIVDEQNKKSTWFKRLNEDKCPRQEVIKTSNQFEILDDMDMFFLSMSRMTKQLPKFEQAQIKLALSNSVLSAAIRCNQELGSLTIRPECPTQQQLFASTHSPASGMSSFQTMASSLYCSGNYSITTKVQNNTLPTENQ